MTRCVVLVVGLCLLWSCAASPEHADVADAAPDGGDTECTSEECRPRLACNRPGGFCDPGTFCNSQARCIAEGTCAVDDDCLETQTCAVDRRCIAQGACIRSADCEEGKICSDGLCVPGSFCGESRPVDAEALRTNLLVLLDRSCSMRNLKWDASWQALLALAENPLLQTEVRWGLSLFPDTQFVEGDAASECAQDAPFSVTASANNWVELREFLLTRASNPTDPVNPVARTGPCVTNIRNAVFRAAEDPALTDLVRDAHLVLVSDGKQYGCGYEEDNGLSNDETDEAREEETVQRVAELNARGVHTYVVGFNRNAGRARLTRLAEAGGTAIPLQERAHPREGFLLADVDTLLPILLQVAQRVIDCDFRITEIDGRAPTQEELDSLSAFLIVDEDPKHALTLQRGVDWALQGNLATLLGARCDAYKDPAAKPQQIVFTVPCRDPE